jgi:outer membrane protein TolC
LGAGATTQLGFYFESLPFCEMRITVFPHMRVAIVLRITLATTLSTILAHAETRVDLATLVARAKKNAQVDMVRAGAEGARAKRDEVSRAWTPHIEMTTVGGPSPEIRCNPSPENCVETTPTEKRIGFEGIFFHLEASVVMPVYTFGKISAGTRAAEAGIRAADALAAAAEAQAVLDASRAYYGVKLARELLLMLDEGAEALDSEIERIDDQIKKGKGDVTESDRHRLKALRAELDARVSEARRGERMALAGVRFFVGGADGADADVDDAPLAAVEADLPTREEARARSASRAQKQAADAGVAAAGELVAVEKARWFPDLVAVGQTTFARSSSTDDPKNAFYSDPFNVTSFSIGVALRWAIDPFSRPTKIAQARADEKKAVATAKFAETGVAAEAEKAWADASDARDRLTATRRGEKEARAWYVATLQ